MTISQLNEGKAFKCICFLVFDHVDFHNVAEATEVFHQVLLCYGFVFEASNKQFFCIIMTVILTLKKKKLQFIRLAQTHENIRFSTNFSTNFSTKRVRVSVSQCSHWRYSAHMHINGQLCVTWQDKKRVTLLSNYGDCSVTSKQIRCKKSPTGYRDISKPNGVIEYNKHMGGTDLAGQQYVYYAHAHRSVKWWKRVFLAILDMCTKCQNTV